MAEVSSERVPGEGQMFLIRVEGEDRVWHTRNFGFKEREKKPVMIPYWFEAGKCWHLYDGRERTDTPPLASFATMRELKAYVGGLAG